MENRGSFGYYPHLCEQKRGVNTQLAFGAGEKEDVIIKLADKL